MTNGHNRNDRDRIDRDRNDRDRIDRHKNDAEEVLVIPCSGIGKVHGLMSREAAYLVTEELAPGRTDVVCLALLVKGDEEALTRVRTHSCIAIDGCGKACAKKNVEAAGGEVAEAFQVARYLSRHRGAQPGTGSELTEEGWAITREVAQAAAGQATRLERERREVAAWRPR